MPLMKVFAGGLVSVFLAACGTNAAIYERTDVHLIAPCQKDENICRKKLIESCSEDFEGNVIADKVRQEDVPVQYILCRPPQKEEGEKARLA